MSRSPRLALATTAALLAGAASAHAAPHRITLEAGDRALTAHGARPAPAGFTRIVIRNRGEQPHGIALVRLKRRMSDRQLLRAFAAERRSRLASLGGIPTVAPGDRWEMTQRLTPGAYAFVDISDAGQGHFTRFRVVRSSQPGHAPRSEGALVMREYRFRLPHGFDGRGTLAVRNLGRRQHELTLVRIEPGHTQQEVLDLILAGAQAPPSWAQIVEGIGVLDPGRTAYVRFHLRPGRYVALSLLNQPGSDELDAQRGMIGTFDVGSQDTSATAASGVTGRNEKVSSR